MHEITPEQLETTKAIYDATRGIVGDDCNGLVEEVFRILHQCHLYNKQQRLAEEWRINNPQAGQQYNSAQASMGSGFGSPI